MGKGVFLCYPLDLWRYLEHPPYKFQTPIHFSASLHYKATSIQALHKNTFGGGGNKYATTARGVTSASAATKDFNHNTLPHPGHVGGGGGIGRMGGRKHNSSFNVTEELCEFQVTRPDFNTLRFQRNNRKYFAKPQRKRCICLCRVE